MGVIGPGFKIMEKRHTMKTMIELHISQLREVEVAEAEEIEEHGDLGEVVVEEITMTMTTVMTLEVEVEEVETEAVVEQITTTVMTSEVEAEEDKAEAAAEVEVDSMIDKLNTIKTMTDLWLTNSSNPNKRMKTQSLVNMELAAAVETVISPILKSNMMIMMTIGEIQDLGKSGTRI
jgi:hypothetical protein